jgi:DNA-binding CsgD family transcriptional regulator
VGTAVSVTDRDLRVFAAIVSQERPDLPAGEGLPPSLLADLMDQIRCDGITLERYDVGRQRHISLQNTDTDTGTDTDNPGIHEAWAQLFWTHYWDCRICSYPPRTGDLRGVVKTSDFYSTRQWHSTGMYADCIRPQGIEHHLMVTLPELSASTTGTDRYLRLVLHREPGPDFSERDRALMVLLRPHLHQAYLDVERRRNPVPRLTPRQTELLRLVAAGHTNAQIARRLGLSEGTVRTHLDNIYERLGVSSRTAAVLRAFPDSGV